MSLLSENTARWDRMQEHPDKVAAARSFAGRAMAHKSEYEDIAEAIRVQYNKHIPWWFIPLVHERECIGGVNNWSCNIAQGKPFNVRSSIVPYNGPFPSFQAAAIAALVHEAPFAANNTNWSGGGTMTIAEHYNGLKYAEAGRPSPYIWAGTDQYVSGKVMRDHGPIENVVDQQLGVAISLRELMKLDHTIVLDGNLPEQTNVSRKAEVTSAGAIVTTGATAVQQTLLSGADWTIIAGIAVVTIIAAIFVVRYIIKKKKGAV